MGQTPAKMFPMPTPYGQSPDQGALMQAKAAPLAPPQTFLPLNPGTQPTPQPAQNSPAAGGFQGGPAIRRINSGFGTRFMGGLYD